MAQILGIGGVFFRSRDPAALAEWYAENLGIDPVPQSYDAKVWQQQAGATVFAPFATDTDYFGNAAQQWMINFRVDDLQGMVASLEAKGIEVNRDPQNYPNGRFARLHDPEGNPIELWQEA